MGQPRPLFYFRPVHNTMRNLVYNLERELKKRRCSVWDSNPGPQAEWMVGADESAELWRPPTYSLQ